MVVAKNNSKITQMFIGDQTFENYTFAGPSQSLFKFPEFL